MVLYKTGEDLTKMDRLDLDRAKTTASKQIKINLVCSGSVVVTVYYFESGRPGSNPEWGPTYYEASITAQGLPEPSFLLG